MAEDDRPPHQSCNNQARIYIPKSALRIQACRWTWSTFSGEPRTWRGGAEGGDAMRGMQL